MHIAFWGSPEFALPSLRVLLERHELLVITQPDRPAGRGRKLRANPVKRLAMDHGLPVLQPTRPKGEDFLAELRAHDLDLSVVVAYGQLLVEPVLDLPALGSINVHASLLPELRGAAPINWAIIRGHPRTGVTIMRMVLEMDAGPILCQRVLELDPRSTAGDVSSRLSELGAAALLETVEGLERGTVEEHEQDHSAATFAPKLDRAMARLDWALPAEEIARWIRGCDPWPGAWTTLEERPLQVFQPEVVGEAAEEPPGTVVEADPRGGVVVATGGGHLRIGEVKPADRGRMTSAAWVMGRGARAGQRFL